MTNLNIGKPVEILLVEDDPGDVDLTMEVLENAKVKVNLNVVCDGVEAIKYLRQKEPYPESVRPDLILLDLNMPKKDGREVVQEIKSDSKLKSIPIVVLTTSSAEEDVAKTYNLGANCFVTKPVGLKQFQKVVESIENFWFTVVKFPPRD